MSDVVHVLWSEKYRPQKIDDCILSPSLKSTFLTLAKEGNLPHFLFVGPPGSGKTTVAKALCSQLDIQCLVINGSDERGIDILRNKIKSFASALSLTSNRRCVIIDEADYLTPETQAALRFVMEEFASNCSFILTCNFKNKIIDPLHSRCSVKDFRITKQDRKIVIEDLYKRISYILTQENIEYDKKVLANVLVRFFPDFRRLINELQSFSKINGAINEGILTLISDINIHKLYSALKDKKFNDIRDWVIENLDNDSEKIYRKIYDGLKEHLKPTSIPQAIIFMADYQYKSAFSADQEINLLACMIEIMVNCEFVS